MFQGIFIWKVSNFYFLENWVTNEKSSFGKKIITILSDIIVKVTLKEITYGQLLKKSDVYLALTPSEIRRRNPRAKIAEFMDDSKKLCNFAGVLKNWLTDQLVFGVR